MTNSTTNLNTIGFWAVHSPKGVAVPESYASTGSAARGTMVSEIWPLRREHGFSLVRYLPQVVDFKAPVSPEIVKGVTGAEFWRTAPGSAACDVASEMRSHGAVERTIEAVELALTAAGFNITDPVLKDCLQTAFDSMVNTVE